MRRFRRRLKKQNTILVLIRILGVCLVPVIFVFGRNVPYESQASIYEGLRNTSGIVFGVMGAWMAIVYPVALGKLFKDSHSASTQVQAIMSTMVTSVVILSITLLIEFTVPLLRQFRFSSGVISNFRGVSYALIFVLTAYQLKSLFLTLLPNYIVKDDLKNAEAQEEMENYFLGKPKK
jgi:hypothetical protein